MKKSTLILSVFIALSVFMQFCLFAAQDLYPFKDLETKEEIKKFIKLHQRAIVGKPDLKETKLAKFAVGEYYFKHRDLYGSRKIFRQYTQDYPPHISTLIAQMFLLKIAKLHNDVESLERIKKETFEESFVILFSDYKVLKYKSAFGNNYTVHYYLNKVEVFLNDELFEKVEPQMQP